MKTLSHLTLVSALIVALGASLGCQRAPAASAAAAPKPPEIPVVRATAQTTPDALAFTGRIDALHHVELRPRVSGSIAATHFQEGALVRAGAVLFEIDPRPYVARREQAAADVARATAAFVLAEQEAARARVLLKNHAISTEELERRAAEASAAQAARLAAQAALATADLDVEFTRVRAPVDGRISRALVTTGNLAAADRTLLATLVSVDPMRVRFSIDEPAFQRLLNASAPAALEARVTVAGFERSFTAKVDYVGNAVDTASGTVEVRATLASDGTALVDGMFARVELLLPADRQRVLVPETALGAEQGSRYVLVSDADNKLVQRRVTLGPRFGPQRAITTGLEAGEFIVTAGLQFLRPGMTIRPLKSPGETLVQQADQ
jgi:RND family efflux transporter MFP subunit